MSNINKAFEQGKASIAFITCGDPDLETTAKAIKEAVSNGANMIELGIPFSDPTAEGPIIQAANIRALSEGITTDKIFQFVKEIKKEVNVPIVFMTYANVVFSYGAHKYIMKCHEVGVDGLAIPDLPYEEKEEFLPLCQKYDVDMISTIAKAPKSRIEMIAKEAQGFINLELNAYDCLNEIMNTIKESTNIPCVINIEDMQDDSVNRIMKEVDGIAITNDIVKQFAIYGQEAPVYVGKCMKMLNNQLINVGV